VPPIEKEGSHKVHMPCLPVLVSESVLLLALVYDQHSNVLQLCSAKDGKGSLVSLVRDEGTYIYIHIY
jgi:hypothetical protein